MFFVFLFLKESSYAQTYSLIKEIEIFRKNTGIPVYTFGEELVLSGGFLLLCAGTKSYCDSSSLVGNLGVNYRHTNVSSLINNNLLLTLNVFTTN